MTNEEALDKVRKLLALAGSENENEAALAAARAQAIMDKHQISQASLDVQEDGGAIGEETLDATRATWRGRLAVVVAKANGCKVWKDDGTIQIAGRPGAVNATRYLFDYCAKTIDRLAGNHKGNGRTFLNNYRLGCVDAISTAVREEKERTRAAAYEAAGGTSELIVLDRALARIADDAIAVDDWTKSRHKFSKASRSARADHQARAMGQRDGSSIYPGAGKGVTAGRKRIG